MSEDLKEYVAAEHTGCDCAYCKPWLYQEQLPEEPDTDMETR